MIRSHVILALSQAKYPVSLFTRSCHQWMRQLVIFYHDAWAFESLIWRQDSKLYHTLQSSLKIQLSALLYDGTSRAGDFKSDCVFVEWFYPIRKKKNPKELPMGCTWATGWAARRLSMGILPCKLGWPLLPYMEPVGSSVGSSIGSPLRPKYEKSGQLSGQGSWRHMGVLPCKLGCLLLRYMETVGSSVGSSVGKWAAEWAAHGNFAMQIRLPTTSLYENSGQLSGQPTSSKYEKVGSSVGSGMGCLWEFCNAK